MANDKSVEEKVEDRAKVQLALYKLKTYAKTESVNSEIDGAMKNSRSKSGGSGGNYPDIRLLLETKTAFPLFNGFNKRIAFYFISLFGKYQSIFQGGSCP